MKHALNEEHDERVNNFMKLRRETLLKYSQNFFTLTITAEIEYKKIKKSNFLNNKKVDFILRCKVH